LKIWTGCRTAVHGPRSTVHGRVAAREVSRELETKDVYQLWAAHYPPVAHNRLMEVEQAAVLSLLPPLAGLTALDAGCGTGRYMRALEMRRARRVFGIDNSSAMLARSRGRVALGDLCGLPIAAASVDVVVSGLALNDIADLVGALSELALVLKPGGVLVYSTLHPRGAKEGWTRTFEAEGRTWSLPAYWHSAEAHEHACANAGLAIEAQREPEIAGRGPVALVIRARRTQPWNLE